jgi:integrase
MNKGYLLKRGKSSWRLQVYIDGQRHTETVIGQKRDAQNRLNELLVEKDKGLLKPTGQLTVGQHFTRWLEGYAKTNCSQRTYEGYQSIIKNHLTPAFGSLTMKQLTPPVIQAYYGQGCEKLSKRTVHHQHRVLSESLKYAIRQGYLGRNPCDLVNPPRPVKKTMRTLTPSEVEHLLDIAKDSYFYPIIYFAVSTGLRQAEILGLRWRDVDLDMLSISVNQVLYKRSGIAQFKEPKTQHSRRRVRMTPKLAVFLKEYRNTREWLYVQSNKLLSLDDLLFTTYQGKPLNPSVVTHNFFKLALQAGLKGVRFHDLRHTFASLMLLRGVSAKVISEALGHSSVAFTMDVYSHIIEGMQEDAMKLLDDILPAGNVQEANHTNLTPTLTV